VISGMADQIPEPSPAKPLIQRNTQHLLGLINQILDLRKLESGKLSLSLVQTDVIQLLKYGTESFKSLAVSKSIELDFHSDIEHQMMDLDTDKLLMVHTNLISNAIKFTPEGGKVRVVVEKPAASMLSISVADTGKGIAADKLPMVFDRFYQVDDTSTRKGEGTGIGLALTKELVQLMGGSINTQSTFGQGSRFQVHLPITQEAPVGSGTTLTAPQLEISTPPPLAKPVSSSVSANGERPSLLIIEDNPDIVHYLYTLLKDEYDLSSAADGQAGIDAALEQVPDLIITDVMMPHKNGYEVCETLKLDERTSHIPIVMLTAKADTPSRLEGYKRGADAYLAKPFDRGELLIRLEKLLELRRRLQQRYQQGQLPAEPSDDPQTQAEDAFIIKAREQVLAHLDDSNYRGEGLMKDLGIGRTNLHRKLKALTGLSTSHFIRAVRIEEAKKMLGDPELRVSEVAYMTGFADPKYFNRVFTEVAGTSPSDWRGQAAG
ncbi:MAG: ATP-binding protein, partial [Bacteroidota bacterium]